MNELPKYQIKTCHDFGSLIKLCIVKSILTTFPLLVKPVLVMLNFVVKRNVTKVGLIKNGVVVVPVQKISLYRTSYTKMHFYQHFAWQIR